MPPKGIDIPRKDLCPGDPEYEQLGRVGYGIEMEPRYCELVIMRWEAATGQQAVKGV